MVPSVQGTHPAYNPELLRRSIQACDDEPLTGLRKGIPSSHRGGTGGIGSAGLALARQNIPMPAALLRQSAIATNREWMRQFLNLTGCLIAPHGKTSMAPALFEMQLQDGAWGISAATAQQVALFADAGIRRIILANQLVGAENIRTVLDKLATYPDLDFYCLVDSVLNIRQLAEAAGTAGVRLQVFVEIGARGGRTGARGVEPALELARKVKSHWPVLSLRGIEAYEGIFGQYEPEEKERRVRAMLGDVLELAARCDQEDLFDEGVIVLTAGGSEFLDLASLCLRDQPLSREHCVVIRSGCYLTHDSLEYERAYRRMLGRTPDLEQISAEMSPALEVWGTIQSRPEPRLAFAALGKRDISFDLEMPVPLHWFRWGEMRQPAPLPPGYAVMRLNDQHAFLELPEESPLSVGDLVGFGVSHVCTTFDKWQSLLLVDDDYEVTGAIRTFF